jgi:two-component system, cell cycle sensor histidine kinase and response regulator CckA
VDTPIRVLIVEDSSPDAELLVRELERGGYVVAHERVQTASSLQEALVRSTWDVIVADYDLPTFSGPEALVILQATGLDIPFIIVSGTIGEEIAVSALKAGAHDFLVKGRLARLIPAIQREQREVEVRRGRARAQEALQRSEAQYRSLVDGAVFGIFQATAEGHFVTVNQALVTILGYASADDLLQVGWAPLHDDPEVAAALIRRSYDRTLLAGEEAIWHRKNGDQIRVRLSGRLIEEPHTRRSLSEVMVEDITEQHRLHEQLRQAQKMEAIGQLAGGVAHDFNNMLTIILGYSGMLTEQIGPDKPIGQDLRDIRAAAERAAALTKQLLAFSRKQVFSMVAVDVTHIVRTVKPMLQRLLGERITITTALADDLLPVMADIAQLEHLLINLSVNARDAMPDGGALSFTTANVTLDAAFIREHPGATIGPHAMLSVADTGIGMSPAVQARIFEPFFTTKESGRGTGLGLAAAYGTVKQLDGYIQVESYPGRGSTFKVYLPKAARTAESPRVAASVSAHVGNETILLVEDESGVRAFVRIALQRFGYRIIESDTAEAALILLKEYAAPIHLLLTDVVLPGMDGIELASHVTRERPDTRVLVMSGYARGAGSIGGRLDPSIHLLEKPFTAQALLTKTRELLGIHAERC